MPTMRSQSKPTKKDGGLVVPLVLAGGVLGAIGGLWWWSRRSRDKDGLPAPAFFVASPSGPDIS